MYNIEFTKQAIKDLRKIPRNNVSKVIEKIKILSGNPRDSKLDIKQLKGVDGYRLRVGDYRVIYEIEDAKLIIKVIKVQSRGNVYG
jgi:mRNA interferase RelE/StbE